MSCLDAALRLAEQGKLEEAITRALSCAESSEPEFVDALHLAALFSRELGLTQQAKDFFEQALKSSPRHAQLRANYGNTLAELGEFAAAQAQFEGVVASAPDHDQAWMGLANLAYQRGEIIEAVACCSRAIEVKGTFLATAYSNRSSLRASLGEAELAKSDAQAALQIEPHDAGAMLNLACAEYTLQNSAACIEWCERVLQQDASRNDARFNMALAYMQNKNYLAAQEILDKLVKNDKKFARAYEQLAICFYNLFREEDTAEALDARLMLGPDAQSRFLKLLSLIPIYPENPKAAIFARKDFLREAAYLKDWLTKNHFPDGYKLVGEGITPFFYVYHNCNDKEVMSAYGQICSQLMQDLQLTIAIKKRLYDGNRSIRLGIVSAYFKNHAIWQDKIAGLFRTKSSDFEIYSYHLGVVHDEATDLAIAGSQRLVQGHHSLQAWVTEVQNDQLDILYFPEVGLEALTIKLAALRLAPVQVSSWGNPGTTGMPEMDYFISANVFEADDVQSRYTEDVCLLKAFPTSYARYQGEVKPFDLQQLGLVPGKKIALMAGTPYKYQYDFARVYVEIAKQNPDTQFIIFAYDEIFFAKVEGQLRQAFVQAGLPTEQLITSPWLGREYYQYLMMQSTLLLDSFGFSGINTVMQALEVGLPVVTLRGDLLCGRLGSGVLDAAGLADVVAETKDDYIKLATQLIQNNAQRDVYRQRIFAAHDVLFENDACIDETFTLFREMVQAQFVPVEQD